MTEGNEGTPDKGKSARLSEGFPFIYGEDRGPGFCYPTRSPFPFLLFATFSRIQLRSADSLFPVVPAVGGLIDPVRMAYLVTIRTYDNQGAAALDQSLLEAEGIAVHLLNYDSALSDFGGQLKIRLQVPGEESGKATMLLEAAHPSRAGSAEVVSRESRAINRVLFGFLGTVLVTWLLSALFLHVIGESPPMALRHGAGLSLLLSVPLYLLVRYLWRFTK